MGKEKFTYTVRGSEIIVTHRKTSISRSIVYIVFHRALELGEKAAVPESLGTLGTEYLYPIFQRFGVIRQG